MYSWTISSVERVFSDTGNLITKRRAALDSDTVDQMIFIRNFIKIQKVAPPKITITQDVSGNAASNLSAPDTPALPSLPNLPECEDIDIEKFPKTPAQAVPNVTIKNE